MFKLSRLILSPLSPFSASLTSSLLFFTRNSKPIKKPKMVERKTGIALSDEKSAKLAKEEEAQEKKKKIEAEKRKVERAKMKKIPINSFDVHFETKVNQAKLEKLAIDQSQKLLGISAANKLKKDFDEKRKNYKEGLTDIYLRGVQEKVKEGKDLQEILPNPNSFVAVEKTRLRKKAVMHFWNSEEVVNSKLAVKRNEKPSDDSKRTGLLARKVGMTTMWDCWGKIIPLTALQVDRCQVIQVKTKEKDGVDALQIGAGQKNLKRLKKPEIGHYLKVGVPPKESVCEFKISPENALPPGFQLGARHFVPGQWVDVLGVTNGKGFQGTIKRFHFKMQPATHGCSVSHRVMGSTGNRTDPGRVFKNKKMPGRMGGKIRMVENLRVYKIDYERALIFVVGAVPGRRGNFVRIRDAYKKTYQNESFMNYPTFVPEKGKAYAIESIMEGPEDDPEETISHDNIVVEDDENVEE